MNARLRRLFERLVYSFAAPVMWADDDTATLDPPAGSDTGEGDTGDEELPYGELPEGYFSQQFGSEESNPDHRPKMRSFLPMTS